MLPADILCLLELESLKNSSEEKMKRSGKQIVNSRSGNVAVAGASSYDPRTILSIISLPAISIISFVDHRISSLILGLIIIVGMTLSLRIRN